MSALLVTLSLVCAPATATVAPDFEHVLTRHTQLEYSGDLVEIKRRGVLRVLTRNNSSSYFVSRGRQLGFQFELARAFAKQLGVRLAMVVPSSRAGLIPALLRGEGDLIAAGMSGTPARAKLVRLTPPLVEASRVIVTHKHIIKRLEEEQDVAQFTVHLNLRSTTHAMVRALSDRIGAPITIGSVPSQVEMEEMIRRVGTGEYEATIVDQNVFDLEFANGAPVVARIAIGAPLPKVWAVRPGAVELGRAASEFVQRHARDGLIRIVYQKYFTPRTRNARRAKDLAFRADGGGRISPFDAVFREQGARTGLDWRLLASVAYSESRFDAAARSRFGAVGLMQLLPATARQVGRLKGDDAAITAQLLDPSVNARVGAQYLKLLIAQFDDPQIEPRQRIRFGLAAYNAGIGHILDARALAVESGLDRDRWFTHVERALLLKKDPRWHQKTKHGYCRADETVRFVSRVQARYDVYVRHVPFDGSP